MTIGARIGLVVVAVAVVARAAAPSRADPPGCAEAAAPALGKPDRTCASRAAGGTDTAPDLSTMKTPASPAFMVLGLTPSQIQVPTTPLGAAFAIAGGFASGVRSNPLESFALETTPFWLMSHPDLTFADLEGQRHSAWYRNASVSAATAPGQANVSDGMGGTRQVDARRAALGVRTTVWPGEQSLAATRCQRFLMTYLEGIALMRNGARKRFHEDWERSHPRPAVTLPPEPKREDYATVQEFAAAADAWAVEAKKFVDRDPDTASFRGWIRARDEAELVFLRDYESTRSAEDPALATCLKTIHERRGFVVEVAGAAAVVAPVGDWARVTAEGSRSLTGWLTAGYVWDQVAWLQRQGSPVTLSLLGAVRGESAGGAESRRVLDLGGRAVVAWQKYGAALEWSFRRGGAVAGSEQRLAVTFDYHLRGGMWLDVAFGWDFANGVARRPLIALANLEYAFGRDRVVLPDSSNLGLAPVTP